jgi:two-component system, NtrC family, nitrogen regulation sensor histidine kinase NtrY
MRSAAVPGAAALWVVLASAALVAGAWWLRSPEIRYLVACAVATAGAGFAIFRARGEVRRWGVPPLILLVLFVAVAASWQRDLSRIASDWDAFRARAVERGLARMGQTLERELEVLQRTAAAALAAPDSRDATAPAFQHLHRLPLNERRSVVLISGERPVAWAGTVYASPGLAVERAGLAFAPFHVVLYATADSLGRRAVAASVLSADPPADRLVHGLQDGVAQRAGLSGFRFDYAEMGTGDAEALIVHAGGAPVASIKALAPNREEALLLAVERARSIGVIALGAALLLLVLGSWRVRTTLRWRLVPLAATLAVIALVPLSAFSRVTVLFDPTVYFAEFGGAFTANVGALLLSGIVMLLGVLLLLRGPLPIRSRAVTLAIVLMIIAGGPYLLRLLSRGVAPPPGGISAGLWLAWEVALFLFAATLLVLVAALGPRVRRAAGGLHPGVAPTLAATAALVGPLAMEATGGWPAWYAGMWIVALGAVAITRRHRWSIISAALVAALGAATVTWNAGVRGAMVLAAQDFAAIGTVEPFLPAVLDRMGEMVEEEPAPRSDADLLRAYVRSDLEGTGFPVRLTSWSADGVPSADLALSPIEVPFAEMTELTSAALVGGTRVIRTVSNMVGAHLALGVPFADGTVLTVVVAPRTRLIPESPYNVLLGLDPIETGVPPYRIALLDDAQTGAPPDGSLSWYRAAGELHAVSVLPTPRGLARVHVEVPLRSLDVLVQRGTLVVLFNVMLMLGLWMLSTLPGGGLRRWLQRRLTGWQQSYRARLIVALFGFFVIPAAAFAAWSYQRLQTEDRQARELLVREMLRALSAGEQLPALEGAAASRGAPISLYRHGELWRTSVPLLNAVAPTGRFLPPDVHLDLTEPREVFASRMMVLGRREILFGYRPATDPMGVPVVMSAPARGDEAALERRRRDLGILVLFATVIGAFAALWLSGVAARSLEEPIGQLRRAALAIASGEREPPLQAQPPLEFRPVFSGFRRMAADLGESRAALEAAQRRTAAVLRNVASGVVAVGADGRVVLANPRAESLLHGQLPPGAPMAPVGGEDLASRVRAFLDSADEDEEMDIVIENRQIHVRLTRLPGAGRGTAVVTLDDVTELARAQRVLAWGEMARQVAHEIKNPLTPIRLGVQHLKRAHGDAHPDFERILDQNVARILAEIDRLDEIARSFSRYGALPADRLRPVVTDVAVVARDVLELERLGKDDIDWQLEGAELPLVAMARAEELREVLLNLLENARLADATRIAMRLQGEDGLIVIEVRDDGRGIPAQILPRIFEPHFSTRTSGSGLGLAVSRQLVESWGGTIAITSNGGTLVRVELVRAG